MRHSLDMKVRVAAAVAMVLLAACERRVPPGETPEPKPAVPAPQVTPAAATPSPPAADAAQTAAAVSPPAASAPIQAPTPVPVASEPELASMLPARAPSKLSVPVDLRYQFDGDATAGQPVTLHLAAVPRIAGSNLKVSIKDVPGVRMTAGAMSAQKASAATTYRQQMSVTRLATGPAELRVLVTMDLPEGAAFGWFSVPFASAPAARKQGGAIE